MTMNRKVKRYTIISDNWDYVESPTGGFVDRDDYAVLEAECERLREAVAEFFHAKQAQADFERDNPGNSTKRWDACLIRVEVAEDAMLDALAASTGQEVGK